MARESTIGSVFMLEDMPASAGAAITDITVGATTEITVTGTFAINDYVTIAGTGSSTLDRKTAHRVSATGTGTITIDTDTTGETIAAGGTATKIVTTEVCFSEFGVEAATPGEVDVTTMCDLERRNVAGLSSPGSASFSGPLDLTDVGQQKLLAAHGDGLARNMIWTTRGGQVGILYGVVTAFAAAPQGVEQAVTFNGAFQIQDRPIYLPPVA
jgi:hypothetical protein